MAKLNIVFMPCILTCQHKLKKKKKKKKPKWNKKKNDQYKMGQMLGVCFLLYK